jgi:hypothetical protein
MDVFVVEAVMVTMADNRESGLLLTVSGQLSQWFYICVSTLPSTVKILWDSSRIISELFLLKVKIKNPKCMHYELSL